MRIAITRPQEDAAPLKAKLEALGHRVMMTPLLTIRPRRQVTLPDLAWQAIAVTSANAIRALPDLPHLKTIRTLTVGPQSLKAATGAGFNNAECHGGDVNGLAAFIRGNLEPANGPILYLSGAETAGDLEAQITASGFPCHRAIVYDAIPASSLGATETALRHGKVDAVMLYSPRSARLWVTLVDTASLTREAAVLLHLCLSRNVAQVLPEAWAKSIAETADEAALLALLEQSR